MDVGVDARAGVTGATGLLAILGDPIAHAASPALVNERLAALGVDAVLVPWHVTADGLPAAVQALRAIRNLAGAIVTMPHKVAAVAHVDRLTAGARAIGAVNVVRRAADGSLEGTNLDGDGFVEGLRRAGHALAGRRVHLVGAGGAAAAVAFALARSGAAAIAIGNRSAERAAELCERLRAAFPALPIAGVPAADARGAALVVNATSLGMRPDDPLPVDVATLERSALAAEVVATPAVTPFLVAAAARGCATHPGRSMLEAQIELMVDYLLRRHAVP
jgi:shikimate dehydrogenase